MATLCNVILGILASTASQEEEIKDIRIGKEEVKMVLFVDEKILCSKNVKTTPKSCWKQQTDLAVL